MFSNVLHHTKSENLVLSLMFGEQTWEIWDKQDVNICLHLQYIKFVTVQTQFPWSRQSMNIVRSICDHCFQLRSSCHVNFNMRNMYMPVTITIMFQCWFTPCKCRIHIHTWVVICSIYNLRKTKGGFNTSVYWANSWQPLI